MAIGWRELVRRGKRIAVLLTGGTAWAVGSSCQLATPPPSHPVLKLRQTSVAPQGIVPVGSTVKLDAVVDGRLEGMTVIGYLRGASDSAGKVALTDDGLGGDAVAGDNQWHGEFVLHERYTMYKRLSVQIVLQLPGYMPQAGDEVFLQFDPAVWDHPRTPLDPPDPEAG